MSSENLSYNTKRTPVLNKTLVVPTSKSFANRALILAAINDSPVTLNNMPESTDVVNMKKCLRTVGIEIIEDADSITIVNSFPECEIPCEDTVELVTGDGGTTNRFIIPLLALGSNRYSLKASEMMLERPMDELDEVMTSLGVEIIRDSKTWFSLKGPYKINRHVVDVDCSRSTQFATGLALSLSKLNVDITPVNLTTSTPYWEMTVNIIDSFKDGDIFDVPVDFSSLSYPLAMASFSGRVLVKNCRGIDRFQADSTLIYLLEELGLDLEFSKEGLVVAGRDDIPGFEKDCKDCPDLVPTLCFIASYSRGTTKLYNVDVLKHKECDRLAEMQRMLKAFGVSFSYDMEKDILSVTGRKSHKDIVNYDPPVDHRMVMVAYLFQRFNGGGVLENSKCVAKSFPNFFTEME